MKLNDHIIITLSDFSRYFDPDAFWANRYAFIRDMKPEKVYYYQDKDQINAYEKVCKWIEAEKNRTSNNEIRKDALSGLQMLTDNKINSLDFSYCDKTHKIEMSDIIKVNAPTPIYLEKYENPLNGELKPINLHKIVINGVDGQKSKIYIGKSCVGTFNKGEIVYVTESNGKFIEVLPNRLSNKFFDAELFGKPDNFRSILKIKEVKSGEVRFEKDVVSFALVEDGYIYVDNRGMIVGYNVPDEQLYRIKDDKEKVVALNYNNGVCKALYENGILMSSDLREEKTTVYINKR